MTTVQINGINKNMTFHTNGHIRFWHDRANNELFCTQQDFTPYKISDQEWRIDIRGQNLILNNGINVSGITNNEQNIIIKFYEGNNNVTSTILNESIYWPNGTSSTIGFIPINVTCQNSGWSGDDYFIITCTGTLKIDCTPLQCFSFY